MCSAKPHSLSSVLPAGISPVRCTLRPGLSSGFRKMLCWLSVISRMTTLSTTGASMRVGAARVALPMPQETSAPPSAAEACRKRLRSNDDIRPSRQVLASRPRAPAISSDFPRRRRTPLSGFGALRAIRPVSSATEAMDPARSAASCRCRFFPAGQVSPVAQPLLPRNNRSERKWQLAGAALAIASFGLLLSQQRSAFGLIVFGLLIAFSNTILAYSLNAYQSELYPTRIRARAVGFTYSWSRFSTIFVGFFVAFFLRNYGTTGVFLFIASAMVAVIVVIASMGPRTTNLRLEEISQ